MREDKLEYIAEYCARVHRANERGKIPYSFEFDPDLLFDKNNGLLGLTEHARGFTCSTFVVALFRSSRNPLVHEITWPRRADEADVASRQAVLDMWRGSGRPELVARAREIAPTITTMRIRPEQVSGACLQQALPVGFRRANANGQIVLDAFDRQFGPPSSLRPPSCRRS